MRRHDEDPWFLDDEPYHFMPFWLWLVITIPIAVACYFLDKSVTPW